MRGGSSVLLLVAVVPLVIWSVPGAQDEGGDVSMARPTGGDPVEGLSAALVPLERRYACGEELRALFYLTNIGNGTEEPEATAVDGRLVFLYHIRIHVLDAAGDEVPYTNWRTHLRMPPVRRAEEFAIIPVGRFYGREFTGEHWRVALDKPGTYEVYATFTAHEDGAGFGLQAWTGELESNRTRIEVVE